MLCNIKPVPFHESDKHIFAKISGGVRTPPPPRSPPSGSAHAKLLKSEIFKWKMFAKKAGILICQQLCPINPAIDVKYMS